MYRPSITDETHTAGVGPISLDCDMARTQGWTEKALNRALEALGKISRREGAISHRAGPVKGCRCITCDRKVTNKYLRAIGYSIPKWRKGWK